MATGKKDELKRKSVRVLGDTEIISLVHSPVAIQHLYTFHARVPAYNVVLSLSQRNNAQQCTQFFPIRCFTLSCFGKVFVICIVLIFLIFAVVPDTEVILILSSWLEFRFDVEIHERM